MATCGLWLGRTRLVAVVLDDRYVVATSYAVAAILCHRAKLLTRVVGQHGAQCAVVMPEALLQGSTLGAQALALGLRVWLAPEPLVAAAARLIGPPWSPRRMATTLARLPACKLLTRHLRRHQIQLHLC